MTDCLLETGHTGAVLDVALDSSGRHMATASEDGTVCLYKCDDPSGGSAAWVHCTTFGRGDQGEAGGGAVRCVAWAPRAYYSAALVACTERDCQVALWCDVSGSGKQYERVYVAPLPAPGCRVAWAPQEYGKLFTVGCENGTVVIFTGQDQLWDVHSFNAHHGACTGLCCAPFFPPGALLMAPLQEEGSAPPLPVDPPRIATCGCGKKVKVWSHSFAGPHSEGAVPQSVWSSSELPTPVRGTWREVAWAPCVGLPFTYVAAGSEEGHVVVWWQDGRSSDHWQCTSLPQQSASVTKLSWSLTGTFLLVSCSDGVVTIWKEAALHKWEQVSEMNTPATV